MEILHILAGGVVGFVIGLTGVGGGSFMTPILVLGFGISPAIAVGTDLLYASITKSGGVLFHQAHGTIDWRIVRLLGAGSIPASIFTIIVLDSLRETGFDIDNTINSTLSFMLILTALVIIFKDYILTGLHASLGDNRSRYNALMKLRPAITLFVGLLLGILVTISSVGAGAIGAAILFLLYPNKPSINIVGTDLAHAVPLTAIAGLGHMHYGSVDFALLTGLLAGGIPAIYLGSLVGKKLPDKILRPLVAALLMGLGIRFAL